MCKFCLNLTAAVDPTISFLLSENSQLIRQSNVFTQFSLKNKL